MGRQSIFLGLQDKSGGGDIGLKWIVDQWHFDVLFYVYNVFLFLIERAWNKWNRASRGLIVFLS